MVEDIRGCMINKYWELIFFTFLWVFEFQQMFRTRWLKMYGLVQLASIEKLRGRNYKDSVNFPWEGWDSFTTANITQIFSQKIKIFCNNLLTKWNIVRLFEMLNSKLSRLVPPALCQRLSLLWGWVEYFHHCSSGLLHICRTSLFGLDRWSVMTI